jgi:hypothetical protein
MNQNSLFAYDTAKKSGAANRKTYYDFLVSRGAQGATDDEVMAHTSIDHHAVGRIRINLTKMGAVAPTEQNRMTRKGCSASVWVAVPGVDVTKPVPKTERDGLLKFARRKIKAMSDDELREFIESTDDPPNPEDIFNLFGSSG